MSSSQHTRAIHDAAVLKARCVVANASSWRSTSRLEQIVRVSVLLLGGSSTTGEQKRNGEAALPPLAERQGAPRRAFDERVGIWSASISDDYRMLGYDKDGEMHWCWIGSHAEFGKLM